MNKCPLCELHSAPTPEDVKPPAGFFRRAWRGTQWIFPAALLALMPKCPLCVVAYVALFSGIGISVSTARWIQILMLALCLGSSAYLAVRFWRRRALARALPVSSPS
jgi:hypothetical protein